MRYIELSEAIEVAQHAVTLSGALVDSLIECILENWREPIESTEDWINVEFTTAADAALTNIDLWRKNPGAPKGPRVKTAFNSSVGELDARFHPGTYQIEVGVKYRSLIAGCLSQIYLKLQKDKTKPDAKLARQLIFAVTGKDKEGNRYPLRNTIYMFASKLIHEYVHGVQNARQNKPTLQSSYLEKNPGEYQKALQRMKDAARAGRDPDPRDIRIYLGSESEIGAHAEEALSLVIGAMHNLSKEQRLEKVKELLSTPRLLVDMLVTPYLTVAGFNRLVPREKQIVNRFLKKVYEGLFNVYKRWKGPKPVSVYDQKMKDFQAKKKAEEEKKARELAAQN